MEKMVLSHGNNKLVRSILGWSITPGSSCPNCSQCFKTCYARLPYNRYPKTKIAWDRNFELAKLGEHKAPIISNIKYVRSCTAVRIHVAGDFFNEKYVEDWIEIVKTFPNLKFYTYSKVFGIVDGLERLAALPNCNIINSIAPDGGLNYGDDARVEYLESVGYKPCPAVRNKNVKCGESCKLCLTYPKVCFNIHK